MHTRNDCCWWILGSKGATVGLFSHLMWPYPGDGPPQGPGPGCGWEVHLFPGSAPHHLQVLHHFPVGCGKAGCGKGWCLLQHTGKWEWERGRESVSSQLCSCWWDTKGKVPQPLHGLGHPLGTVPETGSVWLVCFEVPWVTVTCCVPRSCACRQRWSCACSSRMSSCITRWGKLPSRTRRSKSCLSPAMRMHQASSTKRNKPRAWHQFMPAGYHHLWHFHTLGMRYSSGIYPQGLFPVAQVWQNGPAGGASWKLFWGLKAEDVLAEKNIPFSITKALNNQRKKPVIKLFTFFYRKRVSLYTHPGSEFLC